MAHVLVTGGTGMLGRQLVPALVRRGHAVRVLVHRTPSTVPGVESVSGDVRTGEGLDAAVSGVDTVVHAASSPRRRARATEVLGTRHLLSAVGNAPVHVVYVSIVGVDHHRFPYYKAKWAAEHVVESSPARWSILRATQFHDLLDQFLGLPVFMRTRNMSFQVVDAGEVAEHLVDLVEAGPSGRVPDVGGPEAVPVRELARVRREVKGRAARLIPLPAVGPFADFDRGLHLCPDRRVGRITWREWLTG